MKIINKFDTWNIEKQILNSIKKEEFYVNPRVKVMDKNRFIEKIGLVSNSGFLIVQKKIKIILF